MNVADWGSFQDITSRPELTRLISYFDKHGHEIRIAGGAVRDLVSGKTGMNDIDLATTATPDEMMEMFRTEQVRTINEQGIKHGTVTARIVMDSVGAPDVGENFEVTTLRVDAPTSSDGRRPDSVSFTRDWKIDAERRDLTINSMFLSFDGTVHDFFDGRKDLEAKKVAFVGDTDKRIKEDYLRILRYFRFYGRIADGPDFHEAETLRTIRSNAKGISLISGERIWSELKKILAGNLAHSLVKTMSEADINQHIGLPQNVNMDEMDTVLKRASTNNVSLSPATVLASLLRDTNELNAAQARLKMSGLERDTALFIIDKREIEGEIDLRMAKCWWVDAKSKSSHTVKTIILEFIKYCGSMDLLQEFESCDYPKMPVTGPDLKEAEIPPGRAMGIISNMLKERWKDSNFQLGKEELLQVVPTIMDQAIEQEKAMRKADKERARLSKKRKSDERL